MAVDRLRFWLSLLMPPMHQLQDCRSLRQGQLAAGRWQRPAQVLQKVL